MDLLAISEIPKLLALENVLKESKPPIYFYRKLKNIINLDIGNS